MNEEEKEAIEEQYKKGLVNLGNIIEPLIRQFKNDYSLDIQQLRLVTNYLLLEREFNEDYYSELDRELEKLQKEIEERLKEIDSLYKMMSVKDEEIEELKEELEIYKETENEYEHEVARKDEEIEELKAENEELINQRTEGFWENDRLKKEVERLNQEIRKWAEKEHNLTQALLSKRTNSISKDKIREKIEKLKTLAEKSEKEEDLIAYKNKIYILESLLLEE